MANKLISDFNEITGRNKKAKETSLVQDYSFGDLKDYYQILRDELSEKKYWNTENERRRKAKAKKSGKLDVSASPLSLKSNSVVEKLPTVSTKPKKENLDLLYGLTDAFPLLQKSNEELVKKQALVDPNLSKIPNLPTLLEEDSKRLEADKQSARARKGIDLLKPIKETLARQLKAQTDDEAFRQKIDEDMARQTKGINAYDVGKTLGSMGKFALAYQLGGPTIEKVTTPFLTKLGVGEGLATLGTEFAKDAIIGTPLNLASAVGSGLEGEDLKKDMLVNAGIDILTNTLMFGGGKLLKSLNKSDVDNALAKALAENDELAKTVTDADILKATEEIQLKLNSPEPTLELPAPKPKVVKPTSNSKLRLPSLAEEVPTKEIPTIKALEPKYTVADTLDINAKSPIKEVKPSAVDIPEVKTEVKTKPLEIEGERVKLKSSDLTQLAKDIDKVEEAVSKKILPMDLQIFAEKIDEFRTVLKEYQGGNLSKVKKSQYERIRALKDEIADYSKLVDDIETKKLDTKMVTDRIDELKANKVVKPEITAPKYVKGQTIDVYGKQYKIESVTKDNYNLIDLNTKEKKVFSIADIESQGLYADVNKGSQTRTEFSLRKKLSQMDSKKRANEQYLKDKAKQDIQMAKEEGKARVLFEKEKGKLKFEQYKADSKVKSLNQKERKAVSEFATTTLNTLKKAKKEMKTFSQESYDVIKKILNEVDIASKSFSGEIDPLSLKVDTDIPAIHSTGIDIGRKKLSLENIRTNLEDTFGEDYKNFIDDGLIKKIDRLDKKQISDMTIDDMRDLLDAVDNVRNAEKLRIKDFKINQKQTLKEGIEESIEMATQAETLKQARKGKIGKGLSKVNDWADANYFDSRLARTLADVRDNAKGASQEYLNMTTILKRMSAYSEDKGLYAKVFTPLKEGSEKVSATLREFDLTLKKHTDTIQELIDKNAKSVGVVLEGKDYRFTKDELLHIYANSKDEGLKEGLKTGYRPLRSKTDIQFTDKMIKNLQDTVENQHKDLVDLYEVGREVYRKAADLSNDTHKNLKGYDLIREANEYYYPGQRVKSDVTDTMGATVSYTPPSVEALSFTKSRVKNSARIEGGSYVQTLYKHIDDVSNYVGFAEPVRNARMIINDPKIAELIRNVNITRVEGKVGHKFIKPMEEYMGKWLDDIAKNHPSIQNDLISNKYGKLVRNLQQAAMGMNPSVIIKQPTAYFTAMSKIEPKYLLNPKVLKKVSKEKLETIYKYAPALWERFEGGMSTIELGDVKLSKKLQRGKIEWGKFINEADTITTLRIWNAAESKVLAETGLKAGTDEFYKKVGRLTQDVLYEYQSVYSPVFRTGLQRSNNALVKLGTIFTGQSQQNLNLIVQAIDEMKLGDKEKGLKKILGILASTAAITATHQAIDKVKGKEVNTQTAIDTFKEYSVGTVAFADNIYSVFKDGFDVTNILDQNINYFLKDTVKAFENIGKEKDPSKGYDTLIGSWSKMASSMGTLLGIPTRNIKTYFELALKKTLPKEAYREYEEIWKYKGNKDLYQDYYDIYKEGKTKELLPVLKDLKENKALQSNLKSSIRSKLTKELKEENPSRSDESIKKEVDNKINNLPYLGQLDK